MYLKHSEEKNNVAFLKSMNNTTLYINVKRLAKSHEITYNAVDNREVLSNETPYI